MFRKSQSRVIAAAIVIIVVVAGAVLLLNGNNATSVENAAGSNPQDISPAQYQSQFEDVQHFLLDVRTPDEFASGHIANAVNIDVQSLSQHLNEVPKDQPVVVYCRSGNRSAAAAQILKDAGYTQIYDMGGVLDWTAAGLPLE
ncbi:MAG: rhodanese-like domain-containing protein [Anaerolineae bacterium]|nr:rhodanese-like domain-containing protein [Anaerolineae bacterium]